jgi:septal ring factor EnvC (AmiA/AmiB activator)
MPARSLAAATNQRIHGSDGWPIGLKVWSGMLAGRGPEILNDYPTEIQHAVKYLPLALMLVLLCSCTPQSGGDYDATYQQQLDDYGRQTATTERQLEQTQRQLDQTQKQLDQSQEQQDETERQLQRSKVQADRVDAMLDRWEEQADRQDKIFDALERILSTRDTGGETAKP